MSIFRTYTQRKTTSQYFGVSFKSGKWRCRVTLNGKQIEIGRFLSEQAAAIAFNAAQLKYNGPHSMFNIIGDAAPTKEFREAV